MTTELTANLDAATTDWTDLSSMFGDHSEQAIADALPYVAGVLSTDAAGVVAYAERVIIAYERAFTEFQQATHILPMRFIRQQEFLARLRQAAAIQQ